MRERIVREYMDTSFKMCLFKNRFIELGDSITKEKVDSILIEKGIDPKEYIFNGVCKSPHCIRFKTSINFTIFIQLIIIDKIEIIYSINSDYYIFLEYHHKINWIDYISVSGEGPDPIYWRDLLRILSLKNLPSNVRKLTRDHLLQLTLSL